METQLKEAAVKLLSADEGVMQIRNNYDGRAVEYEFSELDEVNLASAVRNLDYLFSLFRKHSSIIHSTIEYR